MNLNSLLSVYILLGLLLETIFIEYCIAIILNAPGYDLPKKITIPNIVTYTTIIGLVLLMGILAETLPTENPPGNLFWVVKYPVTYTPWVLWILSFLELFLIFLMPIIFGPYIIRQITELIRERRLEK